jgi:hypothetical protein
VERSEPPLERFYSSGDPSRFQSDTRDLVRKRLEAELLENRLHDDARDVAVRLRRIRSPRAILLLCISLLLAIGGVSVFLFDSTRKIDMLKLNPTILHSTEGLLIEALAFKAGSDQGYVERLLAQYRMRIEERKQAAEAGPAAVEPGSAAAPIDFAAVVADREKAAAAAAELQKIAEQRVTAVIEQAAAFFASGHSAAAASALEKLSIGIEETPQALSVEALARAFKAAEAVVRRGREAQEKAEQRLAAVLSAPAPTGTAAPARSEGPAEADAARASAARLADFIRRLSGYEVWDKEIAAAELARITDGDPAVAEL